MPNHEVLKWEFLEYIKINLGRQEVMILTKVFEILGIYTNDMGMSLSFIVNLD